MIIFDEKKYAEKLLKINGEYKYSFRDLIILAKYYRCLYDHKQHFIIENLIRFCEKSDPGFNRFASIWKFDTILAISKKSDLRYDKVVTVTDKEISAIKCIDDYKYEKILFCMLVVAKVFRNEGNSNPSLYLNIEFKDVLSECKVRATKQERSKILVRLYQSGYIEMSLTGGIKLMYADMEKEENVVFQISDYSNLCAAYPFKCKGCGATTEKAKNHNLCTRCYATKRKADVCKNVGKHRQILQ